MSGQKSNTTVFVKRKRKAEMSSGFCGNAGLVLAMILINIVLRTFSGYWCKI